MRSTCQLLVLWMCCVVRTCTACMLCSCIRAGHITARKHTHFNLILPMLTCLLVPAAASCHSCPLWLTTTNNNCSSSSSPAADEPCACSQQQGEEWGTDASSRGSSRRSSSSSGGELAQQQQPQEMWEWHKTVQLTDAVFEAKMSMPTKRSWGSPVAWWCAGYDMLCLWTLQLAMAALAWVTGESLLDV